jgi:hypothetical protein
MAVEIAPDGTIRLVPVKAPYELPNPTAAVANMSGRSCFDWRHVPPATSRLVRSRRTLSQAVGSGDLLARLTELIGFEVFAWRRRRR